MRLPFVLIATALCGSLCAEGATEPVPAVDPAAGAPPAAQAEGEHKSPVAALDTDKDGTLSATEIAACTNEKLLAKLKAADTNADGALDKAELEALAAKHKGNKGGKKDKPALEPLPPVPAP